MQVDHSNKETSKEQSAALPPPDIELGHPLKSFYMMDENYININNGSYGTVPRYVVEAKERYTQQVESKPDVFLNYTHHKIFENRRQIVAQYLDVDPKDFVFVRSATDAANCVLESIEYQEDDILLMFDFVYGAVRTLCRRLVDKYKVRTVEMPTNVEILNSREKLIQLVKHHIEQYGKKIKIAIIDFLCSTPCFILPIEDIIPLFKENGILCMIDGAHAFNQIDFSIRKLDPDFFHTNLHKWAPVPKSLSVLYVKKDLQPIMHPTTLSRALKKGFTEEFVRPGTRDFASIYCVKEAMEFVERIGRERWMNYCRKLALEVGRRVAEIWKTELLVSGEEKLGYMVNVLLPYQGEDTLEKLEYRGFLKNYKLILQVYKYKTKFYIRFSCTIFNNLSDYIYAAQCIQDHLEAK